MAHVKALKKDSVTKICSGQVVVDLATAVKELIEAGVTINGQNANGSTVLMDAVWYGHLRYVGICCSGRTSADTWRAWRVAPPRWWPWPV